MRKMKDSGVPWIGEIPEDWRIIRLRFLASITTGDKDTVDQNPEGRYPFFVRSPIIEKIDTYTYDGEAILMAGDGVGAGKVFHYYHGKFDYHQRVYNIHKIKKFLNGKFLFYFLSNIFCKKIEESNAKSTVDSIRLPMLLDFPIIFGNITQQQKIVIYLDKKCSQIDSIINLINQSIDKLKQYKQSIITEAVTKGLDPNVDMKDSGVEWIGEIPRTWAVKRIKFLLKFPLQYGANASGIKYDSDLPRYIRITDIDKDGNLIQDNMQSLSLEDAEGYYLDDGDILFARSGATVGKTFLYNISYGIAAFAGYLIRARITPSKALSKFIYYYTFSYTYDEWKKFIFSQSTIQNINAEKYSSLLIPICPIYEQQKIIQYLNQKCIEIDSIISEKEKLLEKLNAYKKSLIYECVTGKREIPA